MSIPPSKLDIINACDIAIYAIVQGQARQKSVTTSDGRIHSFTAENLPDLYSLRAKYQKELTLADSNNGCFSAPCFLPKGSISV